MAPSTYTGRSHLVISFELLPGQNEIELSCPRRTLQSGRNAPSAPRKDVEPGTSYSNEFSLPLSIKRVQKGLN